MFGKLTGDANAVKEQFQATLNNYYTDLVASGNVGEIRKEMRKSALPSLMWELKDGQLEPSPMDLSDPKAMLERMKDGIFVMPRADVDGEVNPGFVMTVKEQNGEYELYMVDHNGMMLNDEVKPGWWDRFCDWVRGIFGAGRDEVCAQWDRVYHNLSDAVDTTTAQKEGEVPGIQNSNTEKLLGILEPKEDAAVLQQKVKEADPSFTKLTEEDRLYAEKSEASRKFFKFFRGDTRPKDLPERVVLWKLSATNSPSGTLKNAAALMEETGIRGEKSDIATIVENPRWKEIIYKGRVRESSEKWQKELLEQKDLSSPETRRMFETYTAVRDFAAKEMKDYHKEIDNALHDVLTNAEDRRAFRGLERCVQNWNKAVRMRAQIADGKVQLETLPEAAVVLQQGKMAEEMLESIKGKSFAQLNKEEKQKLSAVPEMASDLAKSKAAGKAAGSCYERNDYKATLKNVDAMLQKNTLVAEMAKEKAAVKKPAAANTKPKKVKEVAQPKIEKNKQKTM